MLKLFALALTVGIASAVLSTLTIKDCAEPANRRLTVSNVALSPLPLVIPGRVKLSLSASLTKPLDNAYLIMDVQKNLGFFGYVKVPCANQLGSCTYDGCVEATRLGRYLNATDNSVFEQIYTMLNDANFKLFGCPVPAPQTGTVKDFSYDIPAPGKAFDWLVNGDYHVVAKIQDKVSKVNYACLDVTVGIMRKPTTIG